MGPSGVFKVVEFNWRYCIFQGYASFGTAWRGVSESVFALFFTSKSSFIAPLDIHIIFALRRQVVDKNRYLDCDGRASKHAPNRTGHHDLYQWPTDNDIDIYMLPDFEESEKGNGNTDIIRAIFDNCEYKDGNFNIKDIKRLNKYPRGTRF